MRSPFLRALFLLMLCGVAGMASARAEPPLYETGPSQDSSFVRFANVSDEKLDVSNGAVKLALGVQGEQRVTRFFPVKAGSKLNAQIKAGSVRLSVDVVAKPGEFITVAVINKAGGGVETVLAREAPTDFNAMRASLALLNFDHGCVAASLTGGRKNARILENIETAGIGRRLINPVSLSVQAECAGKPAAQLIDMGALQAGERYSILLWSGKAGRQVLFVRDTNS